MQIGIANIFHLSNAFNRTPTEWSDFVCEPRRAGDLIARLQPANAALIESMIRAANDDQTTIVPIFEAVAPAGGSLTRAAAETLLRECSSKLTERDTMLDALVLVLSGCMVDEDGRSVDERLLAAARRVVSDERPIIAVWSDLANLSQEMTGATQMSLGYDLQYRAEAERTGRKAIYCAKMLARDGIKPNVEFRKLPLLLPPSAWRFRRGPLSSIRNLAQDFETFDDVLDVSLFTGMPYSDSSSAGLSLLVSTNADGDLASSLATRLRTAIWSERDAFFSEAVNIETAVHEAMQATERPVIIADAGDDLALGAGGEGTGMLWALVDLGAQDACLAPVVDAEAVELAVTSGVGSTVTFDLGGKIDRSGGYPVQVTARVRRIAGAGRFGRIVRLDVEGRHGGSVAVVVSERAGEPSQEMFEAAGIDLATKQVIAVKSSWRVHELFGDLAARIIDTTTPGATTPALAYFDYQRVPRPIYPLDAI